jgi:HEAT repeat protein
VLAAGGYPLVPLKSYFKDIKSHAISVMEEFSHNPTIAPQFFSKLDVKSINSNISATYDKYHYLFNSYTLAAVYTRI